MPFNTLGVERSKATGTPPHLSPGMFREEFEGCIPGGWETSVAGLTNCRVLSRLLGHGKFFRVVMT